MATYKTPYLDLNTWAPTDNVDREEFNANFNLIDGSLLDTITKLGSVMRRVVNTVAELKATNFKAGDYAKTLGFYAAGGGGEAEYIIKSDTQTAANGMSVIQLDNGLKAFLQYNRRIDVLQLGAKSDRGADASPAIQHALDLLANKGGRVIVPDGDYNLNTALVIGSYTYLLMGKNARIYRTGATESFINNGKTGDNYASYGGPHHIVIKGGILDGNVLSQSVGLYGFGGINIAHSHDVIIDGVVIKDIAYSHPIEINSTKGVLIENCEFLGYLDPTGGSRNFAEAIQLDSATQAGFPGWGAWDGTTTKDVTIRGCKFGASGTAGTSPIFTGIGGHSAVHDIFIQDVLIEDCYFEGQTYAGIRSFKWKNVTVRNNRFVSCASPILFEIPTPNSSNTKDLAGVQKTSTQPSSGIKILDNVITQVTSGDGIRIAGQGTDVLYPTTYISDVVIRGNTVVEAPTTSNAISISYCKSARVYDNYGENARRTVYAFGCAELSVCDNSGTDLKTNVVYVASSKGVKIYDNMTDYCGEHGILIDNCSNFKANNNYVEGASKSASLSFNGIHVTNGSTNGRVYENTTRNDMMETGMNYGLRIVAGCSNVKTLDNDLEGITGSFRNDMATVGDSFYMYSTGTNIRFKITVADNGTISAVQA